jgi:hypothetical protein
VITITKKNIVEFLVNDDFINYVINPTTNLSQQWEMFFEQNPSFIPLANKAKVILIGEDEISELPTWEKNEIKNRIIKDCGISSLN